MFTSVVSFTFLEPTSPVLTKVLLTEDEDSKPKAVPVSPSSVIAPGDELIANQVSGSSTARVKPSSAGEFMSLFRKAAAEREDTVGAAELSIKVSGLYQLDSQVKAVIVISMVDDQKRGYWCYKPDLIGLLFKCVSDMLTLNCKDDMASFKVLFKRSVDSAATIELVCGDKNKLKALSPLVHGNRVLCYYIIADTEELVLKKIESVVDGINRISGDDQCRALWFPEAMNYEKFKLSPGFKSATMSDAIFWRLFKSTSSAEFNVPLDTILAHVSVSEVVTDWFMNGVRVHPADWPESVKAISFSSKAIPSGF